MSTLASSTALSRSFNMGDWNGMENDQLDHVVLSVTDATKRLSQHQDTDDLGSLDLHSSRNSIRNDNEYGKKRTASKISKLQRRGKKKTSRDMIGPWKLGKTLGKGSSGRVRLAKNKETGQLAAIKIVPKSKSTKFNNAKKNGNGKDNTYDNKPHLSYSSLHNRSNHSVLHNPSFLMDNSIIKNELGSDLDDDGNDSRNKDNSNRYGIEREIVIMKLVSHPNVMALYEVWENKNELYLVLEYVDGGELFDYLVSKGKLTELEAVRYFKQIIRGVQYCHSFNICHRDLKPENLLLDKKRKLIKIADFGMAALQVSNTLLKTSCGSPHYASPEIVMGKTYNGGPSDVWSCGIILFALLTGHLPFNDDSIKKLLIKVQNGRYQMPNYLSKDAKDLISRILLVNPKARLTTEQILEHPLITKYDNQYSLKKENKLTKQAIKNYNNLMRGKSNTDLAILQNIPDKTDIIQLRSRNDIDDSILRNLQILWNGVPRETLISKLIQDPVSEEKLIYSLLWQYKQRHTDNNISVSSDSLSKSSITVSTTNELATTTNSEKSNEFGEEKQELEIPRDAPKLMQKSKFSLYSMKMSESRNSSSDTDHYEMRFPSQSSQLNNLSFPVSSSRSFKGSISGRSLHSVKLEKIKHPGNSIIPSTPKTSLHISPSKRSLIASPSMKSINKTLKTRRTLQNSESKKSLYSLQSISKRSLNLKDYLKDEAMDHTLKNKKNNSSLTSTDSQFDLEGMMDNMLFGKELEGITEEGYSTQDDNSFGDGEDIESSESVKTLTKLGSSSMDTVTDFNNYMKNSFVKAAGNLNTDKYGHSEKLPSTDINHTREELLKKNDNNDPVKFHNTFINRNEEANIKFEKHDKKKSYNLRAMSEANGGDPETGKHSLDPRRNITLPEKQKLETLLNGVSSTLKTNISSHQRPEYMAKLTSLGQVHENSTWGMIETSYFNSTDSRKERHVESIDGNKSLIKSTSTRSSVIDTQTTASEDVTVPSMLAQSSTIEHDRTLLKMPTYFKNTSTTFKDLSAFLNSDLSLESISLKKSNTTTLSKSTPIKGSTSVYKGLKLTEHRPTELLINNKEMSKIERHNCAQSINNDGSYSDVSLVRDMTLNVHTAQAIKMSAANTKSINGQILSYGSLASSIESMVKFEDISSDSQMSVSDATSSSISAIGERVNNLVHKKAVSIDTLTTNNVFTPATDVRVSLYVNNNNSNTYNIPRETTEEALAKLSISPDDQEFKKNYQQKRFSNIQSIDNQKLMSVTNSLQSMFKDLESDESDESEQYNSTEVNPEWNDNYVTDTSKKKNQNRVTMLFDEDFVNPVPLLEEKKTSNNANITTGIENTQKTSKKNNSNLTKNEINIEKAKVKEDKIIKQSDKLPQATNQPAKSETSWFNRLFKGLKNKKSSNKKNTRNENSTSQLKASYNKKMTFEHKTNISFELTHMLTLKEFEKNEIEFKLSQFEQNANKDVVGYNCKFVQNNFKFSIKIEKLKGNNSSKTMITLKKKKLLDSEKSDSIFNKFNNDVDNVIKAAESKLMVN
ncbi:hypothetical protein TPHA_0G03200 [Tetrapisispora phaffii CBS 4417]|uniref:non-specific serine/threonine protein kinase n=1 Tax=Tetrapisispora phaffii (strain ATCC 24235 / CBS 4417 / NBRC 1672 / NRRL Y-8282 / UCD 70-5) TaxID=1071381 RepID=G8BW82_TETPH|nr:hypothetical protein TPHA_0G03200 [Tetrapisispora phaffii CBS 4417]CCE64160.1 hypothetical protein TPHA_0G03200 [Tetrapisispora phaffii CBS 4417]